MYPLMPRGPGKFQSAPPAPYTYFTSHLRASIRMEGEHRGNRWFHFHFLDFTLPLTIRHIAMDKSHRHGAFAHR